jgi:peptidoglycan/xylan/chitin deacetylase (PgdA/CDA1 family)
MSKREIAAWLLGNPALSSLRSRAGALRILAYHRIVAGPWNEFAFDEELISATPEAFEAQMRFVKKNFDVVSFRDLDTCDREGRPWPKRALIVTFDDGYRDNLTQAFPILRDLDLPATIFLATGHIGRAELFWWDIIAYCLKHTELTNVALPVVRNESFKLDSSKAKRAAIDFLLAWAKAAPDEERNTLVENLPSILNMRIPENIAHGMHLSWDEVRQMVKGNIEFGSHTVNHPILNRVDTEHLLYQARESKATIESELNEPVLSFAYPAGTRACRSQAVQDAVASCGYRFGVVYDQGVDSQPDRALLPRIHVDRDQSLSLFRANLLFPGFMLRS